MNTTETEKALALLTGRMERLEKQNRWWMRTALVLGAVLLLVFTLGATQNQPGARENVRTKNIQIAKPGDVSVKPVTQDLVITKNLQLVDENGNLRADLKLDKGNPILSLYDEKGIARTSLLLVKGEPALKLFGEDGNSRVILSIFLQKPALLMYDDQDRQRANLSLLGGSPVLDFRDMNERIRTDLTLNYEGVPAFKMYDKNGNVFFNEP